MGSSIMGFIAGFFATRFLGAAFLATFFFGAAFFFATFFFGAARSTGAAKPSNFSISSVIRSSFKTFVGLPSRI